METESRFKDLTPAQRRALLDLLVLAMYVDGHLASSEDVGLRRILGEMGFKSVYDRNKEFDASVTRVRPYAETGDMARKHAATLVVVFGTAEQRQYVASALAEFMVSDHAINAQESRLLTAVKEMLSIS